MNYQIINNAAFNLFSNLKRRLLPCFNRICIFKRAPYLGSVRNKPARFFCYTFNTKLVQEHTKMAEKISFA